MSYTALYRKFRPGTFSEVRGQEAIVTTLRNQISAGRIGHAYLFCGTRGTGKTTMAKIFAKAVNCEHPVDGNPCNCCSVCKAIAEGSAMTVQEIDAASNNGVENIREIREDVTYTPAIGKYKVYIIDEVHMLSAGAFNALLKTLEEPPAYVIFILATTESHKIPATILSRCQKYDFRRISLDTITNHLKDLASAEGIEAEEKALRYIARKGDGSMRDALSLMDQCISFYLGQVLTYDRVLEVLGAVDTETFSRLLNDVIKGQVAEAITLLDEMIIRGIDLSQFVLDFTWYLRNLMLIKASEDMEEVLDVSTEHLEQLRREAALIREDTLMRYIRVLSELSNTIRTSSNRRVLTEMALIRLCRPQMQKDEISLLERIRRLETCLENGSAVLREPGTYAAGNLQGMQMDPAGSRTAEANEPGSLSEGRAKAFSPSDSPANGFWNGSGIPQNPAPPDLQEIRSAWKAILKSVDSGLLRGVLVTAELKYNADNPQDQALYIVFADFLGERYLYDTELARKMSGWILEQTGRQVEVRFALAQDEVNRKEHLAEVSMEDRVRSLVHMDIEIEEE